MGVPTFLVTACVLGLSLHYYQASANPVNSSGASNLYRGKYIGRFSTRNHGVSGEVYATDARTIHIRGFSYDGQGPDAFFWTGFTDHPSPEGIIIPNEKGTKEVLGAYSNQDITISLPDGLTLRDIKWLAVWCRAYTVNFGDLTIPADLDFPQPHVIGSLSGQQHGVTSGPIVVVDAQTILVPDFTYDGQAPDAHFWVGKGKPGPEGSRVPDETGGDAPLVKSDKKTMVLSLPGDLTIFDIDYFGVWCKLYYVDFGHVRVPQNLNVPPSLKMLGVTPQTKLNCEVLNDEMAMEIRWAVAGESIVMQLVGKIPEGEYMSFGLSGDDSRSQMEGADVVVGWFEKVTGKGHVVDYYIDSKSQCSGKKGVCPDVRLQDGSNNVRLLSAALVNGYTMLTYQRPLGAHDELDKSIVTNKSQTVIWAVGPLNQRQEASYHRAWNKDDLFIEFGRTPKWNCPSPDEAAVPSTTLAPLSIPDKAVHKKPVKPVFVQQHRQPAPAPVNTIHAADSSPKHQVPVVASPAPVNPVRPVENAVAAASKPVAWTVPPIQCHEPEDRVFYAQMGPTGGKRGYSAITGHVGWGISWYINGLLIPEIYVVRGKTYTFIVEGGKDAEVPAKYHPFYITDDPEGGYQYKTQAEKQNTRVFAGVGMDIHGGSVATATGRLCQWTENNDQPADSFASYGAYQRSLSLNCEEGPPGVLTWTPDESTPDLVYYQCYTHRFLGWKIHVVDSCETGGDQDEGESIQTQTAANPHQHANRIPATGGQVTETSDSRLPLVVMDGGKLKTVEHKNTFEKPHVHEKPQDLYIAAPRPNYPPGYAVNQGGNGNYGGAAGGPVLVQRPHPGVPLLNPGNQYLRRPVIAGEGLGIPATNYIPIPPPPSNNNRPLNVVQGSNGPYATYGGPELRGPGLEGGHHPHSYLSYAGPYNPVQRVSDGSGLIYEQRPAGLDYIVGSATGRPTYALANPVGGNNARYETVPMGVNPVFFASTASPPASIMTSARHESRPVSKGASGASSLSASGGDYLKIVEGQQGPVVRLNKASPSTLVSSAINPGSGESVRFLDYLPPQFHTVMDGVKVPQGSRRQPHHRNLPKREKVFAREDEEAIKIGLRSIGLTTKDDQSKFEVIRINDGAQLPFHLRRGEAIQPAFPRQQVLQRNRQTESSAPFSDNFGPGSSQGMARDGENQKRVSWGNNFDRRRESGRNLNLDQVSYTQLSHGPGATDNVEEENGAGFRPVMTMTQFQLEQDNNKGEQVAVSEAAAKVPCPWSQKTESVNTNPAFEFIYAENILPALNSRKKVGQVELVGHHESRYGLATVQKFSVEDARERQAIASTTKDSVTSPVKLAEENGGETGALGVIEEQSCWNCAIGIDRDRVPRKESRDFATYAEEGGNYAGISIQPFQDHLHHGRSVEFLAGQKGPWGFGGSLSGGSLAIPAEEGKLPELTEKGNEWDGTSFLPGNPAEGRRLVQLLPLHEVDSIKTDFGVGSGCRNDEERRGDKVEITPRRRDDLRLVVIRSTDETQLTRELGKILQQLDLEGGVFEKNDEAEDPSTYQQNSTALHILTDIWSTINQDDGSRSSKKQVRNGETGEALKSPQLPANYDKMAERHDQTRNADSLNVKRVQKRSAHHEPGHEGEHDHSHNAGTHLGGCVSTVVIMAVSLCFAMLQKY